MRSVTVEAPASSANLGPGFDVFAIAHDQPRDRIQVVSESSDRFKLELKQVSGTPLPLNPKQNGAGAVGLTMANDFRIRARVTMRIWKRVPIGVGMGSSAASAASAAVAMNELFELRLKNGDLVYYAGKGEEATSGAAHYDNVSASIVGGFVIVGRGERPEPISFPAPKGMVLAIATPVVKLPARKTEYARSILPKHVTLYNAVENMSGASTMVAGFALGDIDLIGKGMNDRIVEEARRSLIPGYDLVRDRARKAGAAGTCISGAGPSMLAVVEGARRAKSVLDAMREAFTNAGVKSLGHVTRVGQGARIVESK